MRAVIARLFLLLPGWWVFFFDNVDPGVQDWTFYHMFWASGFWYAILWAWDLTRREPRCPISVMLARLLMAAWLACFLFLSAWPIPIMSPWRFALPMATGLTTAYVGIGLLSHLIGHLFVYPHDPAGNYYQVRAAGWHPFWDRLWPIFNPDSEVIRNGGFKEPEYNTGFVPPREWGFQCPRCGAAQPESWGVCWMCNYGADGDSSAYWEQYGDVERR